MNFWIIRSIRECSKESLVEAFNEVGTIVITSLVPVWIGMFVAYATSQPSGPSGVLIGFLSGNEAVLFCAALVGPLAYTITKSYGRLPSQFTFKFPHALFFILMLFVIYGSAVGILGTDIASVSSGHNSDNQPSHSPHFHWISALFLATSTSILFLAYALRNNIPTDAAEVMHKGSEDFLDGWRK